MDVNLPESMGGGKVSLPLFSRPFATSRARPSQATEAADGGEAKLPEDPRPVIGKPKPFVVDPHNPIYKPGGLSDMPGEKGKGINVKKNVSRFSFLP